MVRSPQGAPLYIAGLAIALKKWSVTAFECFYGFLPLKTVFLCGRVNFRD